MDKKERKTVFPETEVPPSQPNEAPTAAERDAMGIEITDDSKRAHLDFLTALVLICVSVWVIITSIGYWQKQQVVFYASTGFMPVLIAGGLLIMAIRLMRESLRYDSIRNFLKRLKDSIHETIRSNKVYRALLGLGIFAVYVFFMLGRLSFALASFLTLSAVLVFVRFDGKLLTVIKMLLISALIVAGIVGLFQYAFAVPMP